MASATPERVHARISGRHRDHAMIYENTSEATPISLHFETPENWRDGADNMPARSAE